MSAGKRAIGVERKRMVTALACLLLLAPPIPPPMFHRDIGPGWDVAAKTLTIQDREVSFQLLIPDGEPDEDLAIHFHGAAWFAIDEHVARGLRGPLIVFNNGQGSSVYRAPFEDRTRLARWIRLVEEAVRARGRRDYRVRTVSITSFSAGYGAVREIVRDPEQWKRVRCILLLDSMYASYAADEKVPEPSQIDVWVPFVRSAMAGERTFVFTYSQVPTDTYANSTACARALARAAGMAMEPVERGTLSATLDAQFPLLERADAGGAHLWGYGGEDAQAHMTHARHLADVWESVHGRT
ncbi:MAG: hypothetical protein H6534_07200 [Chthonomonadaceae bacterium]|nr:hypothetical protein [Chthonomonadaceae bacterium]